MQCVDSKASFLFVGDVNAYGKEWLGYSKTNLLGRAARDFASSSGREQMVTEPTHIDGEVLDLVLTDAPDFVGVSVGSLVGISDQSAIVKPWFDDRCVLAHRAKQRVYGVGSRSRTQADLEEHRVARCRAQLIYEDAKRAFTERKKSFLANAANPRKWWSTGKTAVFGASSSLPPLADLGGELVWSSDKKASMISTHFNAKQNRDTL